MNAREFQKFLHNFLSNIRAVRKKPYSILVYFLTFRIWMFLNELPKEQDGL